MRTGATRTAATVGGSGSLAGAIGLARAEVVCFAIEPPPPRIIIVPRLCRSACDVVQIPNTRRRRQILPKRRRPKIMRRPAAQSLSPSYLSAAAMAVQIWRRRASFAPLLQLRNWPSGAVCGAAPATAGRPPAATNSKAAASNWAANELCSNAKTVASRLASAAFSGGAQTTWFSRGLALTRRERRPKRQ